MMEKSGATYTDVVDHMGGFIIFPKGISMKPLLREGECYAKVVKCDREPRVGDLLAFHTLRDGAKINLLHRCIAIEGDTLIMRGDNSLMCERITRADIIGRVTTIYWEATTRRKLPRLLGRRTSTALVIDTAAPLYRLYARLWPALNPLLRLKSKLNQA